MRRLRRRLKLLRKAAQRLSPSAGKFGLAGGFGLADRVPEPISTFR